MCVGFGVVRNVVVLICSFCSFNTGSVVVQEVELPHHRKLRGGSPSSYVISRPRTGKVIHVTGTVSSPLFCGPMNFFWRIYI